MDGNLQFYIYPQSTALTTFLPLLKSHLPSSNGIYNRLQAPHNIPSRRCLFAASFPPPNINSTCPYNHQPGFPSSEAPFTIFFSDRSRTQERQVFLFSSLSTSTHLLPQQESLIEAHLLSALGLLKRTIIADAPGWPFDSIVHFGHMQSALAEVLVSLAKERDALTYQSKWRVWQLQLFSEPLEDAAQKENEGIETDAKFYLPDNMSFVRLSEDDLDEVIALSSVKRFKSTLRLLPNIGILHHNCSSPSRNEANLMIAWAFIGIDGAIATLYVKEDYRGKGLGTLLARELIRKLRTGEFRALGYGCETGWVHAEVDDGNLASESVMKSLGAERSGQAWDVKVNLGKF